MTKEYEAFPIARTGSLPGIPLSLIYKQHLAWYTTKISNWCHSQLPCYKISGGLSKEKNQGYLGQLHGRIPQNLLLLFTFWHSTPYPANALLFILNEMSSSRGSSAGYNVNKISYKVSNSLNVTQSDVFEFKYFIVYQGLLWNTWKFQSHCVTIEELYAYPLCVEFLAHFFFWLWFASISVNWLQIIFQTLTWTFSVIFTFLSEDLSGSRWISLQQKWQCPMPIQYLTVDSASGVQSQIQIPQNLSFLLISQRKIGNRTWIWETGCLQWLLIKLQGNTMINQKREKVIFFKHLACLLGGWELILDLQNNYVLHWRPSFPKHEL